MTGTDKNTPRMGKAKARLSALALAVSLSFAPVQQAQAYCGICADVLMQLEIDTQTILQAIQQSTNSIIQGIQQSTQNIIEAINGSTQTIKGVTEKVTAGQKELTQGQLNYDASVKVSENFAKAQEQFTAPEAQAFKTCELMNQAQQATSAAENARMETKAMTASRSKRNMYTPNVAAAAKEVVKDYNDNYCTPEDEKRQRCTAVTDPMMQGAAVRADTLLTPAANYTYSDKEAKAADAFITMVTNPVPVESLPKALERGVAGERFLVEQMNINAQMSVAEHSMQQIKSGMVAPSGGTQNAAGYSGALSMIGLMKKFTDDKFGNKEYDAKLSGMNANGLLRELNLQTAFSNWVDYQTYMQNERVEALLATQLAAAARERSERQLAVARGLVGRAR